MADRFVDDYLLYLLARASALVSGQFHDRLKPHGLDVAEWRILATLSDGDGMTIGDLTGIVMFRQPTLSKIIDRMESEGLVRRSRDDRDRRQIRIHITAEGRKKVRTALAEAKVHEEAVLAGYTREEAGLLKNVLLTLIRRNCPNPDDAADQS